MIKKTVSILVVGITVLFFILFFTRTDNSNDQLIQSEDRTRLVEIMLNEAVITAEVVHTPPQLKRGLSGRSDLNEGMGMWFDFGSEGKWGIWMKDMNFPIDIIWVDSNYKIVTFLEKIVPETYPKVFHPTSNARFVLELPVGTVEKYQFEVGDTIFIR